MELVRVNEMLPSKVDAAERSLVNAEVSESLRDEIRVALENLKRKSDQWTPFEELHRLMLRISDHLDQENSKQNAVYSCLRAIEKNTNGTISAVKVIVLFIATVAGFWSAVAWWVWRDEIRTLFSAAANLVIASIAGIFALMH